MVYLYAGMGVVMLTGIMAIFEMGLSLTGQSLLSMPVDLYPGSSEQATEGDLLTSYKSLSEDLTGMDICNALKSLPGALTPTGEFLPVVKHPAWNDGCVLEYGLQQVLLAPNPPGSADSYLVLFCRDSDKNSQVCPFVEVSDA